MSSRFADRLKELFDSTPAADNSRVSKCFWTALLLLGIALSVYGAHNCFEVMYNTQTALKIVTKEARHFPAVSVCNANRVHCKNFYKLVHKCQEVWCNTANSSHKLMSWLVIATSSYSKIPKIQALFGYQTNNAKNCYIEQSAIDFCANTGVHCAAKGFRGTFQESLLMLLCPNIVIYQLGNVSNTWCPCFLNDCCYLIV